LEVLEAGEMGVDVGLLGHVAKGSAVGGEVVADAASLEEDLAAVGLKEAGDDLDGGGLAGAVGADVADNLAGRTRKLTLSIAGMPL
jgi:hypothetical protein